MSIDITPWVDEEYLIALRRELHTYPELSYQEYRTSEVIRRELKTLGIPFEKVGPCGIIARIDGTGEGPTLGLRADIDALPMDEDPFNSKQRKTCCSAVPGVAHTCGHDAHTAMLLASAKVLNGVRDTFPGRIYLCFEQGEETYAGIDELVAAVEPLEIEAFWALHINSSMEAGKLSIGSGARTTGIYTFALDIQGQSCHGSSPHFGRDPIQCAAQFISGINAAFTREFPPSETVVLTFGKFIAGTADNIVPDSAHLAGTARFHSPEIGHQIEEVFNRVLRATCESHRCTHNFTISTLYGPSVNDSTLADLAARAVGQRVPDCTLVDMGCHFASDSFSELALRYPSVYGFLGTGNSEIGADAPQHNPKFDMDESALKLGTASTVAFALEYLKGTSI